MRKLISSFLFMFLLIGICAHADSFKGGTFIGQRGTNASDAILDQYILEPDGTAYWNQSNSLVFPLTGGTFLAEVGTWEISEDRKHVILTTIGVNAGPTTVGGVDDVNLINYTRSTQKFKINKKSNTLTVLHRVVRSFNFDQNPLNDQGTVILNSFIQFQLRPVKVKPSDLKVL